MFEIDKKPWLVGKDNRSKMCNLKEVEDVFHFLGSRPNLNEFYTNSLGKISKPRNNYKAFKRRGLGKIV